MMCFPLVKVQESIFLGLVGEDEEDEDEEEEGEEKRREGGGGGGKEKSNFFKGFSSEGSK